MFSKTGVEAVSFMVALDSSRVFGATTKGRFFEITTTETRLLPHLSSSTPHIAGLFHEGEVWLVGPGTRVQRGHPDHGFVEMPPLPFETGSNDVLIESSHDGAPFELFVNGSSLAVAHFDGQSWRQIRASSPRSAADRLRPSIAWVKPGMVTVLGAVTDGALDLSRDGTERFTRVNLPAQRNADTLYAAAWIDGVGTLLGSRYAVMYRREGDAWTQLPVSEGITMRVDTITDLGGGAFLAGGGDGQYIERGPGDEFCPELLRISREPPDGLAPLGDGVVMVVGSDLGLIAYYVTRLP